MLSQNQSPKISIYTRLLAGFGDVMFAVRLARQLKKKGYLVDIIAEGDKTKKALETLNILEFNVKLKHEVRPHAYDVSILGPGITIDTYQIFENIRDRPVIVVSEYDYSDHANMLSASLKEEKISHVVIESGLGETCKGILLEQDFFGKDIFALNPLDKLNDEALKQTLLSDLDDLPYMSTRSLSFAYASCLNPYTALLTQAAYAAQFEQKAHHDLVFISSINFYDNPVGFLNDLYKKFGDDFSLLELISFETKVKHVQVGNANASKTLRVIYGKTLNNEDMLTLQKAAASNLISVTGDQSLGEAISKGDIFFYVFDSAHKINLLKSLQFFAKNNGFAKLSEVISHYFVTRSIVNHKQAATAIEKARQDFKLLCNKIKDEKNLMNEIDSLLQKMLAQQKQPQTSSLSFFTKPHPLLQEITDFHKLIIDDEVPINDIRLKLQSLANKIDPDFQPILEYVVSKDRQDMSAVLKLIQIFLFGNENNNDMFLSNIIKKMQDPMLKALAWTLMDGSRQSKNQIKK